MPKSNCNINSKCTRNKNRQNCSLTNNFYIYAHQNIIFMDEQKKQMRSIEINKRYRGWSSEFRNHFYETGNFPFNIFIYTI